MFLRIMRTVQSIFGRIEHLIVMSFGWSIERPTFLSALVVLTGASLFLLGGLLVFSGVIGISTVAVWSWTIADLIIFGFVVLLKVVSDCAESTRKTASS